MNIRQLISSFYRLFFPLTLEEMYRKMGVEIGANCKIQNGVVIDYSHYWHITIGNNVTIAPHVHILAHDASTKLHLGYTKIGNVTISDNVFIGARSIVLPGVTIGRNSIVGAGSVVTRSIPANSVWAGNPTKEICTLEAYLTKQNRVFESAPKFGEEYTLRGNISNKRKMEMRNALGDKFGFVE